MSAPRRVVTTGSGGGTSTAYRRWMARGVRWTPCCAPHLNPSTMRSVPGSPVRRNGSPAPGQSVQRRVDLERRLAQSPASQSTERASQGPSTASKSALLHPSHVRWKNVHLDNVHRWTRSFASARTTELTARCHDMKISVVPRAASKSSYTRNRELGQGTHGGYTARSTLLYMAD